MAFAPLIVKLNALAEASPSPLPVFKTEPLIEPPRLLIAGKNVATVKLLPSAPDTSKLKPETL